jgi:VIT1/CCC1 family predicted Fe2+/Mn2+ transporter
LMAHDALGSHARDELGITEISTAHPIQAAFASACSFSGGALLPVMILFLPLQSSLVPAVAVFSLLSLILLGVLAAKAGGAPVLRGALRVGIWGALAMAVTAVMGLLIGQAV